MASSASADSARYAARVRELGEQFATAVAPLDRERFHRRPAPDAWSIAEISGHMAEGPLTFATQARALAENPGMPLGRNLDDPGRLAAIARLGNATPAQAAAMIRECSANAAVLIESIDDKGLDASGVRVANGERFSARQVVEALVIEHLEGHLAEVRKLAE